MFGGSIKDIFDTAVSFFRVSKRVLNIRLTFDGKDMLFTGFRPSKTNLNLTSKIIFDTLFDGFFDGMGGKESKIYLTASLTGKERNVWWRCKRCV